MKPFLTRYHNAIKIACAVSSCIFFGCLLMGCSAPTWISDAENLIPLIVTGATSVLTFIAALHGGSIDPALLAEINSIATKVEAGLKNIETTWNAYKSSPNDTTLENIEAATQAAISDINAFFQVTGLPAAEGTKLTELFQLILNEVESLASLIPAAKSAVAAHTTITVNTPMSPHEFKAAFNGLIEPNTGTESVDVALAQAKKL